MGSGLTPTAAFDDVETLPVMECFEETVPSSSKGMSG